MIFSGMKFLVCARWRSTLHARTHPALKLCCSAPRRPWLDMDGPAIPGSERQTRSYMDLMTADQDRAARERNEQEGIGASPKERAEQDLKLATVGMKELLKWGRPGGAKKTQIQRLKRTLLKARGAGVDNQAVLEEAEAVLKRISETGPRPQNPDSSSSMQAQASESGRTSLSSEEGPQESRRKFPPITRW